MRSRPSALQQFLDAARVAMVTAAAPNDSARALIRESFAALGRRTGRMSETAGARLPACKHFRTAIATAQQNGGEIAPLAEVLAELEPSLVWSRRAGAEALGNDFVEGHANARIIGEGGLDQADDIALGVSLMAPRQKYPDHHHPPEEVYIALSAGEWRQENGPWRAPGIGGLVHNAPDVVHSMRSLDAPLLAVWLLRASQRRS